MPVLVKKSVKRTLFEMAFPMLAGTFAMNAYNLTDTWFVAQLGTLPLAAMGFTFPVVMLLTCLAGGLGSGVTTLVSHAIGRSDKSDAARITTHGILLTICLTLVIMIVGYHTIVPVFSTLGADEKTLPLVADYMKLWYSGAIFMALPMIGNGILISCGDSKAAGRFMMFGTLLNTALDPIMIFGYLGFPAMGIRGAALATVISQIASTVWLIYLLRKRYKLISIRQWGGSHYIDSFKNIVRLGVPSILSMILMPVSASIMTWILSRFGNETVAACSAAGRIEMFAFVIPMALGISMMPFISQNFGAGRMDRIREAITVSSRFAMLYGLFIAAVFNIFAPNLSALFSDDETVREILETYIRIISFGYGMMEVHRYSGIILTGLHKPLLATFINAVRVFVFLTPLCLLGAGMGEVNGIFWGRLATDILSGCVGLFIVYKVCDAVINDAENAVGYAH
jgi:putative MATE family efflux protein